jgi:Na+/melibiose symporter-like transporter
MALLALVWAGDKYAWGSAEIIGLFAGSAVTLALFIWQELRHPEPILPLHLFKNRVFLVSNLIVFTFGVGVFGAFQFLGIYVQTALDASATTSGVISMPQSLGVLTTSIIGGWLISRTGKYRWQTVFGTVLIAIALGMLTQLSLETKLWHISAIMVVLGLGFGLVLPTMSVVVQNAVSYQYIGVATSSSQFFRQIGSVLGIAVFGAILANTYHSQFAERFSAEDRATVGPIITAQLDDPTVKLNDQQYARIEAQVLTFDGGEAILERARSAQGESVVSAIRNIYLAAFGAALVCAVFAIAMPELPLRRTVQGGPPGQVPLGSTGTGPPGPAGPPEPVPAPGTGAPGL